jgi:xanthine dehydrogenase YagT iron-sulfur-binding subunit
MKKNEGLSRRDFLKSVGLTSVSAAAIHGEGLAGKLRAAGVLQEERILGPDQFEAGFKVNGRTVKAVITPATTLADMLRDQLDLTGTKIGCNRGACGACTVILDGKPVSSCMTLAVDAIGSDIETIEGLSPDKNDLHPLQKAFIDHDALQCGFCTSGMIMSAKALLDSEKEPGMDEIRKSVSGNLCRCGTYNHVFKAVEAASKSQK